MADTSFVKRVLFVGGDVRLGSVQMRCRQVAEEIGATWTAPNRPDAPWDRGRIPESELRGKDIFILIRCGRARRMLKQRGRVIWDVIDQAPPRDYIDALLTQTRVAASMFGPFIPTYTIPQHHANRQNIVVAPQRKRGRMVWIGTRGWLPTDLKDAGVETYAVNTLAGDQLSMFYARADVLLNTRKFQVDQANTYLLHTSLNSGTKVINAVGFGIPSVTEWEPWVNEVAPGCTRVCAPGDALVTARRLLEDEDTFEELRANCKAAAERYSLTAIGRQYLDVLRSIGDS